MMEGYARVTDVDDSCRNLAGDGWNVYAPIEATAACNPAFDFVTAPDFLVTVPAGQTVDKQVSE